MIQIVDKYNYYYKFKAFFFKKKSFTEKPSLIGGGKAC